MVRHQKLGVKNKHLNTAWDDKPPLQVLLQFVTLIAIPWSSTERVSPQDADIIGSAIRHDQIQQSILVEITDHY